MFDRSSLQDFILSVFPYLLVCVVIGGVGMSLFLHRPDYMIRSLFIIVPCLAAACILIFRKTKGSFTIPRVIFPKKLLPAAFLLCTAWTLYFCCTTDHRTYIFVASVLCLISIIILQILRKDIFPKILLAEILVLGGIIAYSVTLNYPMYFGGTDLLTLSDMINVFSHSGELLNSEYSESYSGFPLYFIYYTIAGWLCRFEPIQTLHIIAPMVFVIFTPFVYLISRTLFENERIALLCSLIYTVLPDFVYYSTYVAPRVMAYLAFLLYLYLIILRQKMPAKSKQCIVYLLQTLVVLYIILVHQVSVFQIVLLCLMAIVIGYIWFGKWYCLQELFLSTIIIIGYWIYTSFGFMSTLITQRIQFSEDYGVSYVASGMGGSDTTISYLFENIGTGILLFFILFGIFFLLSLKGKSPVSKKDVPALVMISLVGLIMLLIYIPNPISLSYFVMDVIRSDRFCLLISPFYAILAVAGILYISGCFKDKKVKSVIMTLITILCVTGIAVFSIGLTSDIVNDNQSRRYFPDDEYSSFTYIETYVPYDSALSSDYFVWRYFSGKKETGNLKLDLPYYQISPMEIFEGVVGTEYTILRNNEFERYGLTISTTQKTETYTSNEQINRYYFAKALDMKNSIYSTRNITIIK